MSHNKQHGQQQQGDQSQRGMPDKRQQQQQQPAPGSGEPEVHEKLPDRERVGDRGSRKPQVDVERDA